MFNSAHLADNNIPLGIRFYKIDAFVSFFSVVLFFFSTIIVPCIKAACFVSSCYLCACVLFASMSYFLSTKTLN